MIAHDVAYWPVATNSSVGPDVGFRAMRKWAGEQTTRPRSRMTLNGLSPPSIAALRTVYSISSSAVASNVVGMVRPSDLAVFRLMTNLNLVGACTGRSAGFSPLRMRST
jgi:hypothetical protein